MKNYITSFLVVCSCVLYGQQLPVFSQYMLNPYIINSASAGIQNENKFFLHYRNQWMGFSNSPKTFAFTYEMPIYDNKMGIGLQFQNDQSHILVNNSGKLSYRYTLDLNAEHKLGFGLYGGFLQRKINYSTIETADMEDPTLLNRNVSGSVFDAGFGAWYTWKTVEAGLSIDQILNNRIDFENDISEKASSFQNIRHFTINAAYEYKFNDDIWAIKPGLAIRSFQGANINMELTAIAKWKKLLWAGTGYRQGFGLIFLAGVEVAEQITFGYSYDYSLNEINQYSSGSHEILLSYRFGKRGGSGQDPDTKRMLRKQANDIRDLRASNEQMRSELDNQKEEIERLKKTEARDEAEMQKIINENQVDKIPEKKKSSNGEKTAITRNSGTIEESSNSEKEILQMKKRIEELENQVNQLSTNNSSQSNSELEDKIAQLELDIKVLKDDNVVESNAENLKDQTKVPSEEMNASKSISNVNNSRNEELATDKFYVVTGAYFLIDDAKLLQKILLRELNLQTQVVSRPDRKYFFVVSKEVISNEEAQEEMKRLNSLQIKKYINGNPWVYGSGKQ